MVTAPLRRSQWVALTGGCCSPPSSCLAPWIGGGGRPRRLPPLSPCSLSQVCCRQLARSLSVLPMQHGAAVGLSRDAMHRAACVSSPASSPPLPCCLPAAARYLVQPQRTVVRSRPALACILPAARPPWHPPYARVPLTSRWHPWKYAPRACGTLVLCRYCLSQRLQPSSSPGSSPARQPPPGR